MFFTLKLKIGIKLIQYIDIGDDRIECVLFTQ